METNPPSVYGQSKLAGERAILENNDSAIILRTSWLFSEFGNNFLKTMLNLASKMDALGVVNDQFGTPTNANDLSEAILKIIISEKKEYGLYHFSNLGETTWYEFAKAIFDLTNTNIKLTPISTEQYKTKALRPKYSVLDKTKIIKTFDLNILNWEKSLKKHFNKL